MFNILLPHNTEVISISNIFPALLDLKVDIIWQNKNIIRMLPNTFNYWHIPLQQIRHHSALATISKRMNARMNIINLRGKSVATTRKMNISSTVLVMDMKLYVLIIVFISLDNRAQKMRNLWLPLIHLISKLFSVGATIYNIMTVSLILMVKHLSFKNFI